VRAAITERGPLGNRDLTGETRVQRYRGRKDTGVALYHLWLIGELMTHSRQGFERRCDLRERIAPPHLDYEASETEAIDYFTLGGIEQRGLCSLREWASFLAYRLNQRANLGAARALIAGMLDKEQIVGIAVARATPVRASPRQRAGALRPFSSGQHGQFGRAANNLPRADPGRADNLKAQRRRTIAMPPAVAVAW